MFLKFVTRVKWLNYGMSYNGCAFIPKHFLYICICIKHIYIYIYIWPSHFHHPQKWTIELLFKIMKSTKAWPILWTPSQPPSRYISYMYVSFLVFLKSGLSHVWMQMKFWILWNFSQVTFCQAIKETKLIFQNTSVTFWTTFL